MRVNGIPAEIEIIRSKRKTLSMQVAADGRVIVRSPMKTSEEYIDRFVISQAEWVQKHLRICAERNSRLAELEPFTAEDIRKMADEAVKVIPERVRHYAPLIGVTYGKITIRNQRSKWGSCTSKGNLNFNCLLMMTPPQVLDSVVVHELCHRKFMNHSKDFYAEIDKVFPEYKKWDKWLKENGGLLIRRMTG